MDLVKKNHQIKSAIFVGQVATSQAISLPTCVRKDSVKGSNGTPAMVVIPAVG